MEKAYDLKALGELVVAEIGLKDAEAELQKVGKSIYFAVKKWMKESATLSETKVDDIFVPFYDMVDAFVLPQIEKFDLDGDEV